MSEELYICDDIETIIATIGDWAEEKGWQGKPPTEDDIRLAREIAARMRAIGQLCDDVERIRNGKAPARPMAPFCGTVEAALKLSKICLMATELAEMADAVVEGTKKDDKVPEYPGEHAELADVFIRGFQYASAFAIDLAAVLIDKHRYNITRPIKHGKLA